MSHKLEKYLSTERKNLDIESPDDNVIWKSILRQRQPGLTLVKSQTLRIRLIKFRNMAAVAFILFSLGYFANDFRKGKLSDSRVTLSSIDVQLGQREKEYKALLSFKTDEVRSFTGSKDEVVRELFGEIKKLDLIYSQTMTDLRDLGPNEKVINTIFDTYEQKIRLLELIILETNKKSHENNEKIIL
jgi:hypothetical protein